MELACRQLLPSVCGFKDQNMSALLSIAHPSQWDEAVPDWIISFDWNLVAKVIFSNPFDLEAGQAVARGENQLQSLSIRAVVKKWQA